MTRQEDIAYDFLEGDRIWPLGPAHVSFTRALKEVLSRIPDEAYSMIAAKVYFVVEDLRFAALNVPFNRLYPPCTRDHEVKIDTIVVFHGALTYPYAALVGLLAHELAHSIAMEDNHLANEAAADKLVRQWGFSKELKALSFEQKKAMENKPAVIHRTKHDKKTQRKAGKLANHPAMKELSRMIEAGAVSRERTIAYLKKGRKP